MFNYCTFQNAQDKDFFNFVFCTTVKTNNLLPK